MPKKCESCRHYTTSDLGLLGTAIRCTSRSVLNIAYKSAPAADMPLTYARDICDREGDGHFVYFEPVDPNAGAAFVQITRNPPEELLHVTADDGTIVEYAENVIRVPMPDGCEESAQARSNAGGGAR